MLTINFCGTIRRFRLFNSRDTLHLLIPPTP